MADPESHRLEHLLRTETFPLRPPPGLNLIRVGSRRWFLETGLGALAGLSVPAILGQQARADDRGHARRPTSVILFWLSGGPSHIDMWDPKPEAPREVRGPFGTIATKIPGVRFSEHLPLQASLLDRLTVIRSVDCRASDHTPITLQAGNPLARRTNDGKDGGGYPSMGSVAAKFRGPNHPHLPPFVGLANSWQSDVWGAGHMGRQYEPVKGKELRGRLGLPQGIHIDRLRDRDVLRRQLDTLRGRLDGSEAVARSDRFTQQAYDMVTSGKARRAFDLEEERASTRDAYGRHSLGEKALLARRLVEAGVTFVLVSGAWGTFDHHGDEVRWGGIVKGLKPLLPRVDRTLFTLVNDLQTRGLLDTTLVLMLGEFGRSPRMTKTAGRGHWQNVMSMVVAGGGLRHGQVIGGTDRFGGEIQNRPVSPSDLAATVYRHLGIDPGAHWTGPQGRPVPIVTQGGRPIAELF